MENRKEMLRGWWWHPDYPTQSVPGVAELLPNGLIRVELFDAFPESVEPLVAVKPGETVPVLFGRSTKLLGNCLTLLNAKYEVLGTAGMGRSIAFLSAGRWIDGAISTNEVLKVSSATVDINGLRTWISDAGGETMELEYDGDGNPIEGSRIKELNNTTVMLDDCTIHILIHSDGDYDYDTKIDYATHAFYNIVAHDRISLDRINMLARSLANFMAFAQGFAADIVELVIRDVPFNENDRLTWGAAHTYQDWELPSGDRLDSISIRERLFTLKSVREEFPSMLKNWIEKYSVLSPVYDSFSSIQRAKFMYMEAEFLSHVRAIESFHRHKKPASRYVDQEDFDNWIESTLTPFLKEHFKRGKKNAKLRENIAHNLATMGNRWPLDQILCNVVSWRSEELRKHIGRYANAIGVDRSAENYKSKERAFLDRIAHTRNIISHGLPKDEKYIPHGPEFQRAIKYLKIVHEAVLLEIMGLTDTKIDDILMAKYKHGIQ